MGDHGPQIFSGAVFAHRAARGFTLILLLALTSCLTTKPQLPSEPSPTAFSALTQDIAKFRGLQIRRDIALARYAPSVSEIDSYGPFQLQQVERVYRNLGLLPNNVELGKALAEYQKLEQLALYDDARKKLIAYTSFVALIVQSGFEK